MKAEIIKKIFVRIGKSIKNIFVRIGKSIKNIFVRIGKVIKNKFSRDMEKGSSKRQNLLMQEYEKGRVLDIDSGIDNKEFLNSGDCKKYKSEFKKPEEPEKKPIEKNKKLEDRIKELVKENPNLKVKIYLRKLLKEFKGNLDQENTRELIKKELEKK